MKTDRADGAEGVARAEVAHAPEFQVGSGFTGGRMRSVTMPGSPTVWRRPWRWKIWRERRRGPPGFEASRRKTQ